MRCATFPPAVSRKPRNLCQAAGLPQGVRVTSHLADVSREADVLRFRDEAAAQHATDRIHLLFNNAGISGGGSLIVNDRDEWERTFNICWGGVYFTTRAFLPLLRAADEAHLVNTSSINGFWASVGPDMPHTAYSAAKFAVKGFTEALIADFRMNAPHIKVSVVMPGHIGTGIRVNSLKVQTNNDSDELDAAQIAQVRARLASMGRDPSALSDADIQAMLAERARRFVTDAPTSAAEAATIILDGVKADRLRILVGPDAHVIDEMVRQDPDHAYEPDFFARFAARAGWSSRALSRLRPIHRVDAALISPWRFPFSLRRDPMRRRQRRACPGDKLIGFVEQSLRHTPEGEVYGAALLLVIEGRLRLGFLEDRPVVVINPNVERVVRDHSPHQSITKHARLAEHPPHSDAAEWSDLLAQELGKAVAGDHLRSSSSPRLSLSLRHPRRRVEAISGRLGSMIEIAASLRFSQ